MEKKCVFRLFISEGYTLISLFSQYGLIGSTEWGEDFAEWIDEHVVAYLNLGACLIHWQRLVHG